MATTAAPEDDSLRGVTFRMSPELAEQVDRIKRITELEDDCDVFRRGFSVLRIVINSIHEGKSIHIIDPENPNEVVTIIPPFKVKRKR